MNYSDLDINLTDEQKAMRDTARKFGMEVMRPAGIELDKFADPADVIAVILMLSSVVDVNIAIPTPTG